MFEMSNVFLFDAIFDWQRARRIRVSDVCQGERKKRSEKMFESSFNPEFRVKTDANVCRYNGECVDQWFFFCYLFFSNNDNFHFYAAHSSSRM